MDYLFFDVECGKCGKKGVGYICEIGYVLTDVSFKVLEKEHFLINPDFEFDPYVLKKVVHYAEEEYRKSPKFPEFFERLQKVFLRENLWISGHTVSADYGFILSELRRYSLPLFEVKVHDIRPVFKKLFNENEFESVGGMMRKLNVEVEGELHNALTDAVATMEICKALSLREGKPFHNLF